MIYKIKLPEFEGPIELLLYFIKKERIDIMNIPIAKIADEFYEYVKNHHIAKEKLADFILMASILLRMKIKAVLKCEYTDEFKVDSPEKITLEDIIKEFYKYKKTSEFLRKKELENIYIFPRQPSAMEIKQVQESPLQLYEVFIELLKKKRVKVKNVVAEKYDFQEIIKYLENKLLEKKTILFSEIIKESPDLEWIILTFIIILHMAREGRIYIDQKNFCEDIKIIKKA